MEKLACLPTQCYDALSGRFEKLVFAETPVELDSIRDQKWSADRVIVYQSVILKHIRTITGAKNIWVKIKFQLN